MQTSQEKTNQNPAHKNSTPQSKLLEIDRAFKVPVEQLFKAFTTSEALKIWWWPKDLYTDHVDIDFREDGKYFINMKGFDQGGGGMTGQFEEIVENERIVMTDQFSDEKGNPISAQEAKMQGVWPKLIYITFDFEGWMKIQAACTFRRKAFRTRCRKTASWVGISLLISLKRI